MELKRVVVTGFGAITPIGNNAKEYWENLIKGESGAAPITLFDSTNFKTKFACEVKNFDGFRFAANGCRAQAFHGNSLAGYLARGGVDENIDMSPFGEGLESCR